MPNFYYEPWFAALGWLFANVIGIGAVFIYFRRLGKQGFKSFTDFIEWLVVILYCYVVVGLSTAGYITFRVVPAQLVENLTSEVLAFVLVLSFLSGVYALVSTIGFIVGRRQKRNTTSS